MTKIKLMLSIATMLIAAGLASAQHGRTETTQILFPKGKTTATRTGRIPSRLVTHTYLVNCNKGQTLAVQLTGASDSLSLLIIGGEKDEVVGTEPGKNAAWAGELAEDGVHKIIVSATAAAKYSIEITLEHAP